MGAVKLNIKYAGSAFSAANRWNGHENQKERSSSISILHKVGAAALLVFSRMLVNCFTCQDETNARNYRGFAAARCFAQAEGDAK